MFDQIIGLTTQTFRDSLQLVDKCFTDWEAIDASQDLTVLTKYALLSKEDFSYATTIV